MSKLKTKTLILGAGCGGLSAAAELKSKGDIDFLVADKVPSLTLNLHNGLHYLHSNDFGTPFPFEFKRVPITEEIWDTRTNEFKKSASVPEMFEYSKKVMENIRHPSSIMDPGKLKEVWVPESNNMDDLIESYWNYIGGDKFLWNAKITAIDPEKKVVRFGEAIEVEYEKLISTIPLPDLYELSGFKQQYQFKFKTLYITNYAAKNIVPNWLIVLYMSDPKFPPYRITVFNGIISMESLFKLTYEDEIIIKYLIGNLFEYELSSKTEYTWDSGRIFGVQKTERQEIVKFFMEKDIYPMGRYGLWNGKLIIDSTAIQGKKIVSCLTGTMKKGELLTCLEQ